MAVVVIPPKTGYAFRVSAGERFRVVDTEGRQVADLVAFLADEPEEYLSQGFTRMLAPVSTTRVGAGSVLWSNLARPLLTITDDPVGEHDLLYPPCNLAFYAGIGRPGKTGCRDHLVTALEPFGIPYDRITDPFNVFMHSRVDDTGAMVVLEPLSQPGDHCELRAEVDLIVGVSACAEDEGPCNGGACTPITILTGADLPGADLPG